jgi:DNA-binding transcriptional LysR family regulator
MALFPFWRLAGILLRVEWDDVRVLLALLRAKNLHDAGARLDVDASTVSRRLSSLEKRLDARLFARTREGLRPTATAERLRAHAEGMEAQATALVQAIRAEDARASGVVRVATTEALARLLVSEGLLGLRREHPGLVIELYGGNQPVDLAGGDADIAVRLTALKQPSLRARCVARFGVGVFAAPAYLKARGMVRTATGLRGHDVLLPTGELSRLPEAQWLASRPGVRVIFRSNSMPALVAAAIDGNGLVPLPLGWGDGEPALERTLVLDAIPKRKVWLVSHETASGRPAVRVVTDQIAAIFRRIVAR